MRVQLFLIIFLLAICSTAQAQDLSRFDLFGGFVHTGGVNGLNGFNTSLSVKVNRPVSFETEFSGLFKSTLFNTNPITSSGKVNSNIYTILAGPHFTYRKYPHL